MTAACGRNHGRGPSDKDMMLHAHLVENGVDLLAPFGRHLGR